MLTLICTPFFDSNGCGYPNNFAHDVTALQQTISVHLVIIASWTNKVKEEEEEATVGTIRFQKAAEQH